MELHLFPPPGPVPLKTLIFILLLVLPASSADLSIAAKKSPPEIDYRNHRDRSRPWSIHIVRIPRQGGLFQIRAVHAGGGAVGLSRLSDQARPLGSPQAIPIAAINGDFYQRDGPYAGDPRGLQIVQGELLSAPSGTASFWIDAAGVPQTTNTFSRFQVTWPDGTTTPMGLNGNRSFTGVELYTPALGRNTQTRGGREFILDPATNSPWLPLQPEKIYRAKVREVRDGGSSPIFASTMVLSAAPQLFRKIPVIQPGAQLTISTAIAPAFPGVRTAISGGPVLLRDGKPPPLRSRSFESSDFRSQERHPRSAIGWNDDYFFLVEVDGRRSNLSVGMTLGELASFLIDLGCRDALNLDGGGSATLWYNGRVQNSPCEGAERFIGNSLVVLQRKAPEP